MHGFNVEKSENMSHIGTLVENKHSVKNVKIGWQVAPIFFKLGSVSMMRILPLLRNASENFLQVLSSKVIQQKLPSNAAPSTKERFWLSQIFWEILKLSDSIT